MDFGSMIRWFESSRPSQFKNQIEDVIAMQEYYQEIKDRKALVPSARRRVCGSKSKRCSLPHDGMTQSQWKKMNGGTIVYNLKEPMTWKEFKQLPNDLAEQYILNLKEKFAINGATLAECFGISQSVLCVTLKRKEVNAKFTHYKRMTPEQKVNALRFFGKAQEDIKSVPENPVREAVQATVELEQTTEHVKQTTENAAQPHPEIEQKMRMPHFSMQFNGPFDMASFMNTVKYVIPEGEVCTIKMSVQRAG